MDMMVVIVGTNNGYDGRVCRDNGYDGRVCRDINITP